MFSGMFFIFTPLFIGYLISITNQKTLDIINTYTARLVYVILFLMGLSLAALDNLGSNLQTILKFTFTFFLLIGSCNLLILPLVDKFMPLTTEHSKNKLPLSSMALESLKLILMVGAGVIVGITLNFNMSWVDSTSEWILLLLLFLIGIQLRNSGLTLKQILLNKHGIVIAMVIIVTSWIGGLLAALFLDIPLIRGLAMASGFGWYSLSGILMGDAYGPIYGGASFMIELLRELVALSLIPVFIHKKPCTSIGYAGATAVDFTLPIIQTCGGVRCVPIAIVSGFILSLMVPLFMLFFVSLGS